MKRLALALAAIGLTASLGAYAALPTGAQATGVNVPQGQDGFFVGASALFWQPTVSGNDLDYAVTQTTPGNNTHQQMSNVDPTYSWGFNLFAGYNLGNGNDVMLEYLRLRTHDDSSVGPGGGFVVPAHYFATNTSKILQNIQQSEDNGVFNLNDFDTYQSGYTKTETDLDRVDLTVGQYFNIGCADQLRLFAGARYAELQRQLITKYSQNPNNGGDTNLGTGVTTTAIFVLPNNPSGTIVNTSNGALQGDDESDFKGIGPIIGLNNTYYLGYGIGFVAGLDAGLLIGDVDDSLTLTNYQADMITVFPTSNKMVPDGIENITDTKINTNNARRVVPVVDAKLGCDYTYPLQNYGSFTLEAGWNVSHYWNAVDGVSGGASDTTLFNADTGQVVVNGFTNVTPTHHTNSVGYQGPYVTLTYRATPTASVVVILRNVFCDEGSRILTKGDPSLCSG